MTTTRKWSVVVLAALLYPVTAWLMGYSIERNVDAALVQLHERAPYITVGERHYHRGWYHSEQDVTLELFRDTWKSMPGSVGAPGGAVGPLRFVVHSDIVHGPWCGVSCLGRARIDSRFVLGGDAGKTLGRLFVGADPLHARTTLGLLGGTTTTVTSPAFAEKTLDDGSKIAWGGIEATTTSDANADEGTLHGTAPRLTVTTKDGKRFEAISLFVDSTSKRALRSLYAGDGSAGAGKLTVDAGPKGIAINALRSESHATVSDGFLDLQTKTGTAAIATTALMLTGAHVDVTLRHLEINSLEAFLTALRNANQPPAAAAGARTQAVQQAVAHEGMAVLSHAPEIAIDRVSLAAASGEVLLTGTVRLADTTAADFAPGANVSALMAKLQAELDLTADDAFLKTLPGPAGATLEPRLQSLVPSGLVTRTGDKFHTKIVYSHGLTTFNGKAFQPPPSPPQMAVPTPPAPSAAPSKPAPRPH